MSSRTPCPTDTAPLGRIRQAPDLGLLCLTPVCWQACSVLQPWLLRLSTSACQQPGRAWASMGGGRGQPHPWAWRELWSRHILFCSPFPARGVDASQTSFAGLALLPSVCAPGQTYSLLSRTLGQLQASMTNFLCITPSYVKKAVPISPS